MKERGVNRKLMADISKLQSKIIILQGTISNLQCDIKVKDASITRRDTEIEAKSRALEEKDATISAISEELNKARECLIATQQVSMIIIRTRVANDLKVTQNTTAHVLLNMQ